MNGQIADRFTFSHAMPRAEYLRDVLTPACEQIVIAGSLRRGLSTVKDIELVALPKVTQVAAGLWGDLEASLG